MLNTRNHINNVNKKLPLDKAETYPDPFVHFLQESALLD